MNSELPSAPRSRVLPALVFYSLLVIIVLAAVPYGSVEPWWKAAFGCAIFLAGAIAFIEFYFSVGTSSVSSRFGKGTKEESLTDSLERSSATPREESKRRRESKTTRYLFLLPLLALVVFGLLQTIPFGSSYSAALSRNLSRTIS